MAWTAPKHPNGISGGKKTTTKTTITNRDGSQSSGYISNGQTYYDNGSRIGAGASVYDTSGRQWTMGNDGKGYLSGYAEGSVSTSNLRPASGNYNPEYGYSGGSAKNYYSNYLSEQESALRQAQRAAEEAARQRTQTAVDANNAYIPQVNQQTDKQLQQAYISSQQAKTNAPQSLAAMGYTGGATESSLLGLDTAYQNQRNNLETSRNTSLDQIRQNAQQIQATGDASFSDLAANYYNQMATAQQNAASAAQSQANWQQQFDAQQKAQSQQDYANSANAYYQDYQAQINRLKAQGYTDDDYEVKVLNSLRNQKIQEQNSAAAAAEQQAFENAIKQQNLALNQARTNYTVNKPYYKPSSGSSSSKPEMSASTALAAYKNGVVTAPVMAAMKYYYNVN